MRNEEAEESQSELEKMKGTMAEMEKRIDRHRAAAPTNADSLFKGELNWKGQIFLLYTHARSEDSALWNFCYQIAKKVHYSVSYVYNYFVSQEVDNYLITRIKKEGQ